MKVGIKEESRRRRIGTEGITAQLTHLASVT